MSFAESMISTLKSNKAFMLDKSKRFRKTLGGYTREKKVDYDLPDAKPEVLEAIKERLQKDRRHKLVLRTIIFLSIVGGVILTIIL